MEEIKKVSLISDKENISEWIKIMLDEPSELLIDKTSFSGEEERKETDCISFEHIDITKILFVEHAKGYDYNDRYNEYYGNVVLEIEAYFIIHSSELLIFKQSDEIGTYSDIENDRHRFDLEENYEILFKQLERKILSLPNMLRYKVDREIEKKIKAHNKSLKRMDKEKRIMEKKILELNSLILENEKNLRKLKKKVIVVE